MSVVPLAIAHAFIDKKSTSFVNNCVRVVNLMDMSGADRMQKILIVCRHEDVRINNLDITIDSNPAFRYLQDSIKRQLGVALVFFSLTEPIVPIIHSSTEEFAYEYCLLELDTYRLDTYKIEDVSARSATFHARFV